MAGTRLITAKAPVRIIRDKISENDLVFDIILYLDFGVPSAQNNIRYVVLMVCYFDNKVDVEISQHVVR